MPSRLWMCVITVALALLSVSSGWGSQGCDGWVAKGNGILVTPQDVDELAAYYKKHNVMTDRENYVQSAIKFKLYSNEADRLELEGDGEPQVSVAGAEGLIRRAEQYLQWVLDQQEVTELAIESYFRSFPERFSGAADASRGVLDDNIREEVRQRILGARKNRIDQQTYAELKERYGVRLCNSRPGDGGI